MALRVLYVFTARKRGLVAAVARTEAPDTLLFGLNHLSGHGVTATFHEPEYGPTGRALARQVGRLGPDALQLRTLPHFTQHDVVFLTGGWPLLLAAQAIPRARRPKLVWLNMTLTNVMNRPGPLPRLVGAAVKRADRIVCVAEFQRRFLHQRHGLPLERLPLALSGTDAAFYDPAMAGAQEERGAVLAAGRDAGRDYATLLRAVEGADVETRIVCSPRNLNLAGLAVPPNVTVRYDISETQLRAEYAAASAVAIPTHGEGSTAGSDCSGTLVLLDALAMGKPAVIAERSSVVDYVTPDEHVRTYPPGDAAQLRANLDRLRAEPDVASTLAAAGRARVREGLTTAHFADRVAAVFHEVASAR
jgi:glycosyltransferase involved in cell wall biosynthesis